MDRRSVGGALVVSASLLASVALSALVVVGTAPRESDELPPGIELPYGTELVTPPVMAAPGRAVPKRVRATADAVVSPFAPGIALEEVLVARNWEESRALIRDLTNDDLRAYAIGDLLPHGLMLVGLSTGAAEVLVADVDLVRLSIGSPPELVHDFRAAYEMPRPVSRSVSDGERAFRQAIEDSVQTLGVADSEVVQAHLDELIACGDPAVEVLIRHVGDPSEIAPGPYQLPVGSEVIAKPKLVGDAVIAVLESITGQTFGDPTRASAEEREQIARAWERWWGLP